MLRKNGWTVDNAAGSSSMTVDKDVGEAGEEIKVEDVVLEDNDCRLGVNAKTREFCCL